MKKIVSIALSCVLIGALYGQDVVELSRREKARRESLKGNRTKIITNADLAVVRKVPAMAISSPESPADSNSPTVKSPDDISNPNHKAADAIPVIRMVPTVAKDRPKAFIDDESADPSASAESLESRLKAALDLVDLLTTNMNALQQEFYSLNTMKPGDLIQQKIAETYEKLQKAQEAVTRLQDQINKRGSSRKGAGSSDRQP